MNTTQADQTLRQVTVQFGYDIAEDAWRINIKVPCDGLAPDNTKRAKVLMGCVYDLLSGFLPKSEVKVIERE